MLAAAVAVILPAGLVVAQVPTHRLASPLASADAPFTEVASVVELASGLALVVDSRERRVVLLDFARGTARSIGRTGSGPGEFRLISRAVSRPGGRAWVIDFGLRRLLPVGSDGTFENPVMFPGSIQIRAADTPGALFGETFLPREAGQERPDSMLILRWRPPAVRIDTLMKYNALVSASIVSRGEAFRPFDPADSWNVLPDGDVVVVEGGTYRLHTYRDGRRTRTTAIPWTPIRITDAEKQAFLRRQEGQRVQSLGAPGATPSAPRPRPPTEFPAAFPVFGGKGLGGTYTAVSPAGMLWVERLRAAADTIPLYDVIDGVTGALLMHVLLPPRSSLAGFGRDVAYVVERDADDVQFVRRYAMPPSSR
jgi:hypothetical protein